MTARLTLTLCLVAAVVVAAHTAQQTTGQTFRSSTDAVTVDVSVKRGNNPVPGLSADDFRLTDNGVEQAVDAVSIEAVPLDITVFHDTSPSQGGNLDRFKDDVRTMAGLLRPGDRLRLLIFGAGRQVVDVFGWRAAGEDLNLDPVVIAMISPVDDGVMAALLHRPDVGRRHLAVALTDAVDSGGVVSSLEVERLAERAETVLHLVLMGTNGWMPFRHGPNLWLPTSIDPESLGRLQSAAEATGGQVHDPLFGDPDPVKEFRKIFDDFRASYVLRYTPKGVERGGWHEIEVTVPSARRATVRARRGYYGSGVPTLAVWR
jgi:hypothetical protein